MTRKPRWYVGRLFRVCLREAGEALAPNRCLRGLLLSLITLLVSPPLTAQQRASSATQDGRVDAVLLQSILAAEDRRGGGPEGIEPLLRGLRASDARVRKIAVRGLGRLERPDLIATIAGAARDTNADVRLEAVNAIAQAAQGVSAAPPASVDTVVRDALQRLVDGARGERDPRVVGALARSIGRLPYRDSAEAFRGAQAVTRLAQEQWQGAARSIDALSGVLHGAYDLARTRRRIGALHPRLIAIARSAAARRAGAREPGDRRNAEEARIRRLAVLTLSAASVRDDTLQTRLLRDPDAQVRRLALGWPLALGDSAQVRRDLAAAWNDASYLVRLEAVRLWRAVGAHDCAPVVAAARGDANVHVRLAAIDALGSCRDRGVALDVLQRLATEPAAESRTRGDASWHVFAHALVALARLDPVAAGPAVERGGAHRVWQVRMYAARAAVLIGDAGLLSRLAFDSVGNVREAAIEGLVATQGHVADRVFIRALASPDYHVVYAAARALRGAPIRDSVVPALIVALERLTARGEETARDPRVEVLTRLGELGSASDTLAVARYVTDFDPAVARLAAEILSRWSGRSVAAAPRVRPQVSDALGSTVLLRDLHLRITMDPASGGGSWTIRLRPSAAPATVARLVALVRGGYFNGLTWHRVEPSFVIQGGSPAMNEYVGDGPFLRDELDLASHVRGTVGISTRGRDTGDAQLFVNLVDNFRLDHGYTVVGEVIAGMDVVTAILEGDVMAKVEVELPDR